MDKREFKEIWLPFNEGHININDEFERDLDQLIQEDKWISVEDEKPNNRRQVIIFYDNKYVSMGDYNNEYEYWDRHPLFVGQINVTHWREKPKPPITKKRGGCTKCV